MLAIAIPLSITIRFTKKTGLGGIGLTLNYIEGLGQKKVVYYSAS